MAIEGYNYDIFISYRQKDNKRDGWVTDFIDNLKGELEATFKEEISVYFDVNPHDGLLETHDVGASLKEKLKCLIFIPIISRTYCDPNSFAWQYEFKAFIEMASNDQFGLKIRTPAGNVTSRILPVMIHQLDPEDRNLIETELGGFLRGIDFIYEEQGVNRPLRSDEDHPDRNLHKVFYRNQINKTANAIKEILSGIKAKLKAEIPQTKELNTFSDRKSDRIVITRVNKGKRKILLLGSIMIASVVLMFLLIPRLFKSGERGIIKDADGKISIIVNNFENLTGDTTLNSWKMGIAELLIHNLGTSSEIDVQDSRTMNELYTSMGQTGYSSLSQAELREAARKLNARNYIAGSFQKSGNSIRIMAKLIDTESDKILWTQKVDGNIGTDYMLLTDSLSHFIKDFLEIRVLEKNISRDFQTSFTKSADAYRKYIEGTRLFMAEDYPGAITLFSEAYSVDSTFALAAFYIANANNIIATSNNNPEYSNQAIKWTRKSYELKAGLPPEYQLWVAMWNSYYSGDSNDVLKYCSLLEQSNIKSRYYWYDIAVTYLSAFKMWDKAANAFSKIETINSEWGEDWKFSNYYRYYCDALHELGNHQKELEIYRIGSGIFPENGYILNGQVICLLSRGQNEQAKVILDKSIKLAKNSGALERNIERTLAIIYRDAGFPDEAEKHFRSSMKMYSNDAWSMYLLGEFLISNDRGLDEGLDLINKSIAIDPENPYYLWKKGLGLFKKTKYKEALEYMENAKARFDDVRPDLDRDLQSVKDALNKQND